LSEGRGRLNLFVAHLHRAMGLAVRRSTIAYPLPLFSTFMARGPSSDQDVCPGSVPRIGLERAFRDEEPNLTVIATGLPLCRPPRSASRSESSSSVAPFAKMNESA
jgi:hypothetical protein